MSEPDGTAGAAGAGESLSAARLLPLVYDELRKLAAARLADEPAGLTLQPTALVHEAYLRLVGGANPERWAGRGHFFAAAATAVRRILVDHARRRRRLKRGGGMTRVPLADAPARPPDVLREDLLALDDALAKLAAVEPRAAELVQLTYFGGLTVPEAARCLGVSPRTAGRRWTYARAWLRREMGGGGGAGGDC